MLVVAAGALGVPFWLILGFLASALWHQHQVKQMPDVFKAKLRMVSGTHKHIDGGFPRSTEHALWIHDVLVVEKGVLFTRSLHFAIADGVRHAQPADPEQVKGLGDQPVTVQFRLDDGGIIEMAVPTEFQALAAGPFPEKQ